MKVSEMFPSKYVAGRHLAGPVLVEVITVKPERMRAGPDKPEETKFVLAFRRIAGPVITGAVCTAGAFHSVLREKLAAQIAGMLGDDTDTWHGGRVVLYPERMTVAKQDVTAIMARAPKPAQSETTASPTPTEQSS